MKSGDIHEVPVEGDFDRGAADAAEVIVFHADAAGSPLVLLRTWDLEVPMQRHLARHLGGDWPVLSIAPPAYERRSEYPMTTAEWSDFFLGRLQRLPIEHPLRLGGWSFAGVVAVEMAERLRDAGREVELILMMDTRVPAFHARPRRGKRSSRLHKLSRRLEEYLRLPTPRAKRAYLRERAARWAERRRKRLRRLLRLDPGRRDARAAEARGTLHVTSFGDTMSLLKVSIRTAYLKYQPRTTTVPIAQYWTEQSMQRSDRDATLGWGRLARGRLEAVGVPGRHLTMFEDDHVPELAARIRDTLRRADRERANEGDGAGRRS